MRISHVASGLLSFLRKIVTPGTEQGQESIILSLRGRQDEAVFITNRKSSIVNRKLVVSEVEPLKIDQRLLPKITVPKPSSFCRFCRFLRATVWISSGMHYILKIVDYLFLDDYDNEGFESRISHSNLQEVLNDADELRGWSGEDC